jgi:hypothetical protein
MTLSLITFDAVQEICPCCSRVAIAVAGSGWEDDAESRWSCFDSRTHSQTLANLLAKV